MLQNLRHEGTLVVDNAPAVAAQGLDGMACGHKTPGRGWRRGGRHTRRDAAFCPQPCDEAQGIYHLTVGGWWHERASFEEILLPSPNYANFIGGLRNVGYRAPEEFWQHLDAILVCEQWGR